MIRETYICFHNTVTNRISGEVEKCNTEEFISKRPTVNGDCSTAPGGRSTSRCAEVTAAQKAATSRRSMTLNLTVNN